MPALVMYNKWTIDIVVMLIGVGQMKYLVVVREDLTNQVDGRALRNKFGSLLKGIICWYRCIEELVADKGKLDANEAT